jgi:ribosomal protein L37AE/L43A
MIMETTFDVCPDCGSHGGHRSDYGIRFCSLCGSKKPMAIIFELRDIKKKVHP